MGIPKKENSTISPNKVNRPLNKWKSGAIEATVWGNEREINGNIVEFKTVSLRRSWRQDGVWRDNTISLRKNDIQKAILVLQKAQEELLLKDLKEDEENE